MHHRDLIPAAIVCLTALGALAACRGTLEQQPAFSISVQGAGNQVAFTQDGSEALFGVRSDTGLGSAGIEQTAGDPPAQIRIRLYLRGLEEFTFEYDETAVIVSVSSHGDQVVSERLRKVDSEELPLAPDSPYWMPVEVVTRSASGNQSLPAYFEVQAPRDYMEGQHKAFATRWIDFYR
jgi:hypothetical protein